MKFKPTHLAEFAEEVLIRCPCCDGCACLVGIETDSWPGTDRRLICRHCGHLREWVWKRDRRGFDPSAGPDIGNGLQVWLKTSCCGEVLWAYNENHIAYMEKFIAAKIRECLPDAKWGQMNTSLESRLPKWMVAGKNRESVLKGLSDLRDMLPKTQS